MLRLQAATLNDCASIHDNTVSSVHLEDITTIGTHAPLDELAEDETYDQFDWTKKSQQVLPIDAHKSQVRFLMLLLFISPSLSQSLPAHPPPSYSLPHTLPPCSLTEL